MRPARNVGEFFTFGGRLPAAVGGLISALIVLSLLGALFREVAGAAALVPALVWRGQVWRLATWAFFETDPFALLFGALTLFWFGRDLCYAWGPRRFLLTVLGVAIGAAGVTCLLARAWTPLLSGGWLSMWPVLLALTLAWGMIFPERQILYMLALPISGRALGWVTVAGTLLFAAFPRTGGLPAFVPHLSALFLIFGYARGWSLRGFWQQLRIRRFERRARRRASHLKVVKRQEPPRWMN